MTGAPMEVIIDHPVSARWRLISHEGAVRLGCWRLVITDADQEILDRINDKIGKLTREENLADARRQEQRQTVAR